MIHLATAKNIPCDKFVRWAREKCDFNFSHASHLIGAVDNNYKSKEASNRFSITEIVQLAEGFGLNSESKLLFIDKYIDTLEIHKSRDRKDFFTKALKFSGMTQKDARELLGMEMQKFNSFVFGGKGDRFSKEEVGKLITTIFPKELMHLPSIEALAQKALNLIQSNETAVTPSHRNR